MCNFTGCDGKNEVVCKVCQKDFCGIHIDSNQKTCDYCEDLVEVTVNMTKSELNLYLKAAERFIHTKHMKQWFTF